MCCTIQNASNVYCCSSGETIFLTNPNNEERICKSEIQSYLPVDIIGPPVEYNIEFRMKNGLIIIWKFATAIERDDALANIDNEMNSKTM